MLNLEIAELDSADLNTYIEGDDLDINAEIDKSDIQDLYDTPEELPVDTLKYFKDRAQEYGIEVQDLIDAIPDSLKDDPYKMQAYLMSKHISHHIPLSEGGDPADPSNWDLEDESKNLKRGAKVKTEAEVAANKLDAQLDAERLNEYIRTKSVPASVLINGDEMGKAYISYTKLITKDTGGSSTLISAALRMFGLFT